MTFVRIRGLNIYTDRHGHRRCYHRATGTAIDLKNFPIGSVEFMGECERISRLNKTPATDKPGTLGRLIKEYRNHDAYRLLASRTRRDYDKCFTDLARIDDTPLSKINPQLVVQLRDAACERLGRKWGNYVRGVLSIICGWGLERGYLASNPCKGVRGIKRPKHAPEANRPWTDGERNSVLAEGSGPLLVPIALMMFCGLDPGDVVKLPKSAIKDGHIDTKRGKTQQPVWLPLPEAVKAVLAKSKHDAITVCADTKGQPMTYWGLNSAWRRLRTKLLADNLVEKGLTLKGLRHTVAGQLADLGYDGRTIADMLGQKTTQMGEFYSRRADKRAKLTAVIKNFDEEIEKRKAKP